MPRQLNAAKTIGRRSKSGLIVDFDGREMEKGTRHSGLPRPSPVSFDTVTDTVTLDCDAIMHDPG